MTVRAAALMTTALLLAPVALGDVLPPKPEPAGPAAPATAPAAPSAPAVAPAAGDEGGGSKVEAGASGDPAAPAEPAAAQPPDPRAIAASSLVQRDGTHDLGGKARIVIAEGFAYLDAADTRKLLTEVWGNPPDVGAQALGAIVPKGVSPLADESWAAIITYEGDGHVADDDAASINYADLLKEMQDGTNEENKEREKAGYGAVTLVGWAQEPTYDKAEHKLYWAKHLKFGGEQADTLNYSIRALGREGVLQVNVIGGMSQLKDINEKVPGMLSMVSFTEGNRYADYKEGDKLAAYGIAGLIAGGVAAKAGLFKLLLASWKFIVIGLMALGGTVWRFFSARKAEDPSAGS